MSTEPVSTSAPTLVDRITAVARSKPDAVVALTPDPLTWGELEWRSNALAGRLHDHFGAGAEPVAVVGLTGTDAVVAPVGVMKTGRPYTWVDAALPPARVRQILELSGAPAAVVGDLDADVTAALGEAGVATLAMDGSEAGTPPAVAIGPDNAATIIFTSGSTGIPKGVVTSHRYHLAQADNFARRGFGPDDHVGLVLPMSFAYGAIVYLRSLVLGSTLHVLEPGQSKLSKLPAWITREGVQIIEGTPSLIRSITRAMAEGEVLSTLRRVESGGEPLFGRDVAALRAHLVPECTVRNLIGSSETGIYASGLVPDGANLEGIIPVGYPEPDTEVTLIGVDGGPIADGETGEILITSANLASGYWGQPDMTAERYQPTPDGRIRYRSGDLGRFLPDGSLLHLGRRDGMVKVRGYLVEPAEVEAALLDTGLVHEVAAIARTDGDGAASLTAYVVPIDGLRSSNAALRRALRERVPEYTVPARMVSLTNLPKNFNGKTDLPALPPPPDRDTDVIAPRTGWERAVARTWAAILGLDEVGVEDDFFACGGDSLAVEELLAAMADDHGVVVRSSDLVECPTVGAFAARTRAAAASRTRRSMMVPLVETGTGTPLFCFAGGGGLAGDFLLMARHLGSDRPVYGLQARGIEGGGIPDWTVERWAARGVREIRAVQPEGPYYLAGHSLGGLLAVEAAHQLRRAGQAVALLGLVDTLALTSSGFSEQVLGEAADGCDPATGAGTAVGAATAFPVRTLRRVARVAREVATISAAGVRPRPGMEKFALFFRHGQIIARRYQPRPWDGPTVVYVAEGMSEGDREYDWSSLLSGPIERRYCPGNHLTILGEPNVAGLAEHFRSRLADPQLVAAGEPS